MALLARVAAGGVRRRVRRADRWPLPTSIHYYHFDGLGSVIALTDSSGSVVNLYEYSVYGEVSASDANHPNRFLFTGREFDKDTGLYYYRARYYNPYLGRFLQTDPIGYGDGMNLYGYCSNGPLNSTDPYGLYARTKFGDPVGNALLYMPGFVRGEWLQCIGNANEYGISNVFGCPLSSIIRVEYSGGTFFYVDSMDREHPYQGTEPMYWGGGSGTDLPLNADALIAAAPSAPGTPGGDAGLGLRFPTAGEAGEIATTAPGYAAPGSGAAVLIAPAEAAMVIAKAIKGDNEQTRPATEELPGMEDGMDLYPGAREFGKKLGKSKLRPTWDWTVNPKKPPCTCYWWGKSDTCPTHGTHPRRPRPTPRPVPRPVWK